MKNAERIKQYKSILEDKDAFRALIDSQGNDTAFLEQMKKENPDSEPYISDLQRIFTGLKVVEKNLSTTEKERLWKRIEGQSNKNRRTLRRQTFLKYAAVILLLLLPSLYFLREKTPAASVDFESILSKMALQEDSIQHVMLVFSNKERIEITDPNAELVYGAEGNISVNSSRIENVPEADLYNQLFVPYGKTTQLQLSDGTKVWVNSGSRLIYPVSFSGNRRELYLEGEIYLEVARDENTPFIVKTDQMEVEVLGTAFNVSAYKNDDIQSVVLANGSVSVKNAQSKEPTIIKPSQKYTLAKSTHEVSLDAVDVFYHICWKYNLIMSDSESLPMILRKLERYYNVRMDYDFQEMSHIRVKGKLDLKNTIEETLNVISITTPIHYSMDGKSVKLSVKP